MTRLRLVVPILAAAVTACAPLPNEMPSWPWGEAKAPIAKPRGTAVSEPAVPRRGLGLARTRPSEPPRLIGLSEDETAGLLGRPAEEGEAAPGKVWIYRTSGCRLAVHLFPDMDRGGFYALDVTAAEGEADACLTRLAGEARKKG
ncbi:MAG: hypothetical protein HY985_13380 [Magnetospirillum sp.]|nr:hypothetical protein [Magnetospirillum sp.]